MRRLSVWIIAYVAAFGAVRAEVNVPEAHVSCAACHLAGAAWSQGAGFADRSRHCESCHAPAGSGRTVPAVAAGTRTPHDALGCVTCHAGHPSGLPYQLRPADASGAPGPIDLDPVSRTCLGCHAETARTRGHRGGYIRHPVGVAAGAPSHLLGAGMPVLPLVDVAGTEDPSDDRIACTTCHDLHASRGPFLLRWTQAEAPRACCPCHDDTCAEAGLEAAVLPAGASFPPRYARSRAAGLAAPGRRDGSRKPPLAAPR